MVILTLAAMTSVVLGIFFSGYAIGMHNADRFYSATVDQEETPIFEELKQDYPELYLSLITPIKEAA